MKDPVCGMEVNDKGESITHSGKEYRFCCASCRWAFEKNPGCTNCSVVEKMLDDLKVSYDVIDVTEKPEYLEKYPIYTAPGVVINGKLEFTGVPKKQELMEKLQR
jgi:YHS domain-containing protein